MLDKTEKRRHSRKNSLLIAKYISGEGECHGVLTDISSGGLFIEAVKIPVVGKTVSLEFSLFSFKKTITVSGTVIRVDPAGFAVNFDSPIEILTCNEGILPSMESTRDLLFIV